MGKVSVSDEREMLHYHEDCCMVRGEKNLLRRIPVSGKEQSFLSLVFLLLMISMSRTKKQDFGNCRPPRKVACSYIYL
jgi:hypothetical protein